LSSNNNNNGRKKDEARNLLQQALDILPYDVNVNYYMSYAMNDINDAITQLIRTLELSMGSLADAYHYLGQLYARQKNHEQAQRQWQRVLKYV
jgi:tetratricopeptide (TPR) repeat protein